MPYPRDPEIINSDLKRLKVEGGWLVYSVGGLIYKTDADYTWTLDPVVTEETEEEDTDTTPPNLMLPDVIENMVWDSAQGAYVSQDIWRSTCAALHFTRADIKYGSIVKVTFQRRANYTLRHNMKIFRVWLGQYPNWYYATTADNSMTVYTEKLAQITGLTQFYSALPVFDGRWQLEEYLWKAPTGPELNDGWIKITIDGKVLVNRTGWKCDDATYKGIPNRICIQDDPSGFTVPEGSTTAYKDIQITVTP